MSAAGLQSQFPMQELSVMGLVEVLPRAPQLLRRIAETERAIRDLAPDVVVTIDAPGFCFRLAKRLKGSGIRLVHYVAPSVWAWRPGRAVRVAALYDHLLTLLPWEPPYFERHGLACTFVGHPAVAEPPASDGPAFRERHRIPTDVPLLAVLPGSRQGEIRRLLPVFGAALEQLARRIEGLQAVVATVPATASAVAVATEGWPVPVSIADAAERADAFAAADAAIAASGTVSVELAATRTPMVVCYRMAPLTIWIARRLVHIPYVSLVNLALEEGAIPELIQEDCTADAIAAAAGKLLVDPVARETQIAALDKALVLLGANATPSDSAARAVLDVIAARTTQQETDNG
jgi:lipid-A-disaccharide synthase